MARPERPRATLTKKLRRSILRGHPWVFDRACRLSANTRPGDIVTVEDERGPFATAMADPDSPIRLRILDTKADTHIDAGWVASRVEASARRRELDPRLHACTAVRLVHGEGDGVPGLVVDVYDGQGIALMDGEGARQLYQPLLPAIAEALSSGRWAVRDLYARKVGRDRHWLGKAPPEEVFIEENGAQFEVDLLRGQKTGLFLDQRENRALIRTLASGRRVLNLFSYSGGFSLAAALGGATRVCSVDLAAPAIEAARRNFERSGVPPAAHEFVAKDVFVFLEGRRPEGFELVICDPPSFASSEKHRKRGLGAYLDVNTQALKMVAHGGLYFSASCSSHVTSADLLEVLAEAALSAGRQLTVLEERGAASDHPVRPGFPEGRYLCGFLCAVE